MNVRFSMKRKLALGVTALAAIAATAAQGSAFATPHGNGDESDHWGVIPRLTIGSPVVALRNGPFGTFGVQGPSASPPYGRGSLGIEVADSSTSLAPPSEAATFGNEVDFFGDPVLALNQVGFHVFQTAENVIRGGDENLPNIRFEIDPSLSAAPDIVYTTMVWDPDPSPAPNRWSPYLDATRTGLWRLTGNAGAVSGCSQAHPCDFQELKAALDDGGDEPWIYTAGVGKGRDHMWNGAVDGLRINRTVYDFEADGVRTRRVR